MLQRPRQEPRRQPIKAAITALQAMLTKKVMIFPAVLGMIETVMSTVLSGAAEAIAWPTVVNSPAGGAEQATLPASTRQLVNEHTVRDKRRTSLIGRPLINRQAEADPQKLESCPRSRSQAPIPDTKRRESTMSRDSTFTRMAALSTLMAIFSISLGTTS